MANIFGGRSGRLAAMADYKANTEARDNALTSIAHGYRDAMPYFSQATASYDPLIERGGYGLDAYDASQGLSPGGYEAFTNSPLYRAATPIMQRGADALEGRAAARGGAFSGNTLKALADYQSGTAGQLFGQYQQGFNPYFSMYNQGVNGRAGGLRAQGALPIAQGEQEANIQSQFGPRLGQIAAGGLMAGQQGAANSWGAGMQLANTGLKALGMFV